MMADRDPSATGNRVTGSYVFFVRGPATAYRTQQRGRIRPLTRLYVLLIGQYLHTSVSVGDCDFNPGGHGVRNGRDGGATVPCRALHGLGRTCRPMKLLSSLPRSFSRMGSNLPQAEWCPPALLVSQQDYSDNDEADHSGVRQPQRPA
jgi:hypothetical protein